MYEYSHLGGAEILQSRYPTISQEVDEIIADIKDVRKTKVSRERTKRGKLLYSPKDLNRRFGEGFRKRGYKKMRDYYTITLADYPVKVKGPYKEIDYVKQKVLVEVQLGKYAFMFYDMAKFQYFFNENKADVGIEIVPAHHLKSQMSTGVSYGEQLVYDIERLKRNFPAVPVKIILIDTDEPAASFV